MSDEERRLHPALKELKQGIVHLGDEFHSLSVYRLASLIIDVGGIIMGAVDDLTGAVTRLEAQVTAENQTLSTVVDSLRTATTEIADLQAQLAAGTPVTSDQLEGLATRVATAAQAMADETAAAQTAVAGGAPPAGGGTPGTAPATGTPDPSAAPADPAAPAPGA